MQCARAVLVTWLGSGSCQTRPSRLNTNEWMNKLLPKRGTRWRRCLRHCAGSRKVAVSIPDGVIGIFHWHNPSGHTMALGSTQPLTEMSTTNISWGAVPRADNLTTFMCRLSWNLVSSSSWNPKGLSWPVMGLLYLLTRLDFSSYSWVLMHYEIFSKLTLFRFLINI